MTLAFTPREPLMRSSKSLYWSNAFAPSAVRSFLIPATLPELIALSYSRHALPGAPPSAGSGVPPVTGAMAGGGCGAGEPAGAAGQFSDANFQWPPSLDIVAVPDEPPPGAVGVPFRF